MDECYTIESQTDCLCVRARWRFDFNIYTVFFFGCLFQKPSPRRDSTTTETRRSTIYTKPFSFFWELQFGATSFRFSSPAENNAKGEKTDSQRSHTPFFAPLGINTEREKQNALLSFAGGGSKNATQHLYQRAKGNTKRTRLDDFRLPTNTAQDRLNEATKQAESDGGGVVGKKQCWVGCGCVATLTTRERADAFNANMVVLVH